MDYSTMKSRVQEYLEFASSDIATKAGNWVNDTRKDLALKHKFGYLLTEAYISMTSGTARYALPTDFLGHLEMFLVNQSDTKKRARIYKTQSPGYFADQYFRDAQDGDTTITVGGTPTTYVEYGTEFELHPTPDATMASSYYIYLWYYAQPTSFSANSDEDHMSRYHFEAIIFGATYRGAMYIDDEYKKQNFKMEYERAIVEMITREKQLNQNDLNPRMKHWRDFSRDYGKLRSKLGVYNVS